MGHAIATQEGLSIEYDEDVCCDVCQSVSTLSSSPNLCSSFARLKNKNVIDRNQLYEQIPHPGNHSYITVIHALSFIVHLRSLVRVARYNH